MRLLVICTLTRTSSLQLNRQLNHLFGMCHEHGCASCQKYNRLRCCVSWPVKGRVSRSGSEVGFAGRRESSLTSPTSPAVSLLLPALKVGDRDKYLAQQYSWHEPSLGTGLHCNRRLHGGIDCYCCSIYATSVLEILPAAGQRCVGSSKPASSPMQRRRLVSHCIFSSPSGHSLAGCMTRLLAVGPLLDSGGAALDVGV